ncbi:hypothetical protein LINGRAHAP2_LOCUS26726 [Linum grandiflorum]
MFNSFQDMVTVDLDPNKIFKALATVFGCQLIIALFFSLWSFIIASTTILVSATTYRGNRPVPMITRLLKKVALSWKGPFITWIHATVFVVGYMCIVFAVMYPFTLVYSSDPQLLFKTSFGFALLGLMLYFYVDVVLGLGVVVAVVEQEICGFEAIGKAAKISKGMRLHGFVVNFLNGMLGWGLVKFMSLVVGFWFPSVGQTFVGMGLAGFGWPTTGQLFLGLVVSSYFCGIKMLGWMSYTIMFFEGMKRHGEEVLELVEDVDHYTKVPIVTRV